MCGEMSSADIQIRDIFRPHRTESTGVRDQCKMDIEKLAISIELRKKNRKTKFTLIFLSLLILQC